MFRGRKILPSWVNPHEWAQEGCIVVAWLLHVQSFICVITRVIITRDIRHAVVYLYRSWYDVLVLFQTSLSQFKNLHQFVKMCAFHQLNSSLYFLQASFASFGKQWKCAEKTHQYKTCECKWRVKEYWCSSIFVVFLSVCNHRCSNSSVTCWI